MNDSELIAIRWIPDVLDEILLEFSRGLSDLCRTEELWECILYSDTKEKSIAFLSGPGTIVDDVARVLRETISR